MSKNTKIFTPTDLYNACLSKSIGLDEFNNDDLEENFEKLSDAEKEKFEKKVEKVAKSLKADFKSFPKNIKTEEDYELLKDIQDEITDKICKELDDYLIED